VAPRGATRQGSPLRGFRTRSLRNRAAEDVLSTAPRKKVSRTSFYAAAAAMAASVLARILSNDLFVHAKG
jgi:hypothetical protein